MMDFQGDGNEDGSEDGGSGGSSDNKDLLSDSQKKQLENVNKQKKFMDGETSKKVFLKKTNLQWTIESSGMSYVEVGKDMTDRWMVER